MIDDEPENVTFATSTGRLRPMERSAAMYLLVLVLNNPSHLQDVLEAWTDAGVPGITVLESTGFQRIQQRADVGLFVVCCNAHTAAQLWLLMLQTCLLACPRC